jgi:hypothetical protein
MKELYRTLMEERKRPCHLLADGCSIEKRDESGITRVSTGSVQQSKSKIEKHIEQRRGEINEVHSKNSILFCFSSLIII